MQLTYVCENTNAIYHSYAYIIGDKNGRSSRGQKEEECVRTGDV